MKTRIMIILTVIVLSSCAPTDTPTGSYTPVATPKISSTPVPSLTSTPIPVKATQPTLLPTQLTALAPLPTFIFLTPDIDQLERWQEYEDALGNKLLGKDPFVDETLCEWKILGQYDREIYVWAVCTGTVPVGDSGFFPTSSIAAVIYLNEENGIQSVDKPAAGSYARDVRNMFPPDVQEMIFNHLIHDEILLAHLDFRREYPESPLIVLDATPTP